MVCAKESLSEVVDGVSEFLAKVYRRCEEVKMDDLTLKDGSLPESSGKR